jgi:hypothetical protein
MTAPFAEVLNEALADEHKARDTYRAIIDRFGPVKPFINIVEAEQTHIDSLLTLFARYDIHVPPEPDPARILPPDTLLDACRQGIEAELQNVAMYDRLLAAMEKADVRMVLERLKAASRDHHLAAFRRCVERSGAKPAGRGGGGPGRGFGGGRGQGRSWRGLGAVDVEG